jgi:hypothetical protein
MASVAGFEAWEKAVVDGHSFTSIGRPRPGLNRFYSLP